MEKKVSKKKIETVRKLVGLIKDSETIMIASIKNLPSRQFQDLRKKLRGKAEVLVIKKRIMLKAMEESEKDLEKLKEHVQEDSAILFSKEEAFELASFLSKNKNPIGAKPGQEAIDNVEVEEGPTDLIPGPAISEFGNLGIKIAVEEGKIAIKEKKVIVKTGEKISGAAASIMGKLDIKPFKIGLEPLAIYDSKTGKIYLDVKIDQEKTIEDLRTTVAKSLSLAQKIIYCCKETIGFLLGKANSEAGALEKLQPQEEKKEEPKEATGKPTEIITEEAKQENKDNGIKTENTDDKEEENAQQENQENKSEEEK